MTDAIDKYPDNNGHSESEFENGANTWPSDERPTGRTYVKYNKVSRIFLSFVCSNAGICCGIFVYTALGALLFMLIEGQYEATQFKKIARIRQNTVDKLWDITLALNVLYRENWTDLISYEMNGFQNQLVQVVEETPEVFKWTARPVWTFMGSFFYCLSIITTTGLGSVTPRTILGKAISVLYCLLGMPLVLLYLANVGDLLGKITSFIYRYLARPKACIKSDILDKPKRRKPPVNRETPTAISTVKKAVMASVSSGISTPQSVIVPQYPKHPSEETDIQVPLHVCLMILVTFLGLGGLMFSFLDSKDYSESAFFCFTSLMTIGLGNSAASDKLEGKRPSELSTIISSVYIMVGLAVVAMCFNLAQDQLLVRNRKIDESTPLTSS